MTELQLYKFCEDKEMDWRNDKLIIWLEPEDIRRFATLLGDGYLCEDGLNINLRNGGVIALELNQICEDFDINPEEIHEKS